MTTKRTDDHKAQSHFHSELLFVIGTRGFSNYRKVQAKGPVIGDLKARTRAGLNRQFEKLRPTVRSV